MFYIFRVVIALDGAVTKSVYHYTDYVQAVKNYYATLSGDVDREGIASNLCMLISETGNVVEYKYLDHTVDSYKKVD